MEIHGIRRVPNNFTMEQGRYHQDENDSTGHDCHSAIKNKFSKLSKRNKAILIGALSIILFLFILVGLPIIEESIRKLETTEMAYVHDDSKSKLHFTVKNEGRHVGPPGFDWVKFPSIYNTMEIKLSECINSDGLPMDVHIAFQFRLRENELKNAVLEFRNYEKFVDILKSVAVGILYQGCSLFNTSYVIDDRPVFAKFLKTSLREKLDKMYADVSDSQIHNIKRPEKYEKVIYETDIARLNIWVKENERQIKVTEAETKRKTAENEGKLEILEAERKATTLMLQAEKEAQAIIYQSASEAVIYKELLDGGYNTSDLLSFIHVETLAHTDKAAQISFNSLMSP